MLKNKKIITTIVAGLTLVGNMVIAPNCFADTVENKAPKNIQDSVKKENKIKRKKRHKGHNKNKKQLVEDKFDIIKAPIRGIDFDDNINVEEEVISNLDGQPIEEKVKETPVNLTNTYLEGNEIPEKLSEVDPFDFEIIKAPIRGIYTDNNISAEKLVSPPANTYLGEKEIEESNKEKLNQPLEKEELNEKLHEEKSIDDLKS